MYSRRFAALAASITLGCIVPGVATAQDSSAVARDVTRDSLVYVPLTTRDFVYGFVAPRAVLRSVALAGYDQWRGKPEAYRQDWRGFEERFGARYGQIAIGHVLRYSGSRIFGERTYRYRLCTCGDSASRFVFAFLGPYRVISPTGVHYSALNPTTEMLSGILSTSLRSSGFSLKDGVRAGATGLAIESLTDLAREFWPLKWRPPFF